MTITYLEVQAIVDPGQDLELAQIGIEYIVISVGNMIISQGTVPFLRKRKNLKQLQWMLNLGDEQTITPPLSNTQDEFSRVGSEKNLRAKHLNL